MKKDLNMSVLSSAKPDRTHDAINLLKSGVKNLVRSGEWERYLKTQALFHDYSFANTLLILAQQPEARRVAGYATWAKLGRQVKKGEKAVWILAPRFIKAKTQENKNGDDSDGSQNEDEDEDQTRIYFHPVAVFDISQTEGKVLPSPARKLVGNDDRGLFERLKSFSEKNGCLVQLKEIESAANGLFSPVENRITIAPSLSPIHRLKTLSHEIAHSILHRDNEAYTLQRADCELEAESVAFIVLHHFGIDAGSYSFGYLASWQGDEEKAIKALKTYGNRIQKTAKSIIEAISEPEMTNDSQEY